jgi:hypothetical protein
MATTIIQREIQPSAGRFLSPLVTSTLHGAILKAAKRWEHVIKSSCRCLQSKGDVDFSSCKTNIDFEQASCLCQAKAMKPEADEIC